MKNFFSRFNKEVLQDTLKEVVTRFPLQMLISIVVTVLFFILIAYDFTQGAFLTHILRAIFSLIITFFLSTGVVLYCEARKQKQSSLPIFGQGLSLIFGIFFYLSFSADFENFHSIVYFILTLTGVISFLFFAPYTKNILENKNIQEMYYVYFFKISVVFFISAIVGISLALLGNGAILSVETLFDIGYAISGDIYGYWTVLALSFFTPIFALTQLPKKENFEDMYFNENVFFNFLIRYIAIPFIYIYFFILYAYTIKVLLNFGDWPKGEVSWMVIAFSIFGYITYIFSYIFEYGNKKDAHGLIVIFRKYFPYAVLPQLGMLFYAIGLRIGQYDITINRYFVVVFGLWLGIISLYFIVSKLKSLIYIPAFLTLLILIISIGPWSVYNLPLTRQLGRLETNLKAANILQGENIVALSSYDAIDQELSKQVYDGIEYVCNFDSCKTLRKIFPEIMEEIDTKDKQDWENNEGNYSYLDEKYYIDNPEGKGEYRGVNSWTYIQKITEELKVRSYSYGYDTELQKFYTLNTNTSSNFFPLDISGYTTLFSLDSYGTKNTSTATQETASSLSVDIDTIEETLLVGENNTIVETINISNVFSQMRELGNQYESSQIPQDSMIFEVSSDNYNYKIYVQSAQILRQPGEVKPEDSLDYTYINGYILSVKK